MSLRVRPADKRLSGCRSDHHLRTRMFPDHPSNSCPESPACNAGFGLLPRCSVRARSQIPRSEPEPGAPGLRLRESSPIRLQSFVYRSSLLPSFFELLKRSIGKPRATLRNRSEFPQIKFPLHSRGFLPSGRSAACHRHLAACCSPEAPPAFPISTHQLYVRGTSSPTVETALVIPAQTDSRSGWSFCEAP